MKQAVSISLGLKTRDKGVEIELLGEKVHLERIGTDGDEKKARELYRELDGKVDAFGVGGILLYINTPWKSYPLHAGLNLIRDVKETPCVDGRGLQQNLESLVANFIDTEIGIESKKVFIVEGLSRYGMVLSFVNAGYECVFGDLMFALGIPIPVKTIRTLNLLAHILLPVVGHFPISMLYSVGESQATVEPKYEKYYRESAVIAGDWLYIKKHMPDDMEGKIIVTNTTTPEDVDFMRSRGIRCLVTTTPNLEGRSFGTNAMEAAITAAAGKNRPLTDVEIRQVIQEEGLTPCIRELR